MGYSFYLIPAILGLLVGSFVNVLIYRIPRNMNFVTLRSQCESCQSLVRWYQNIPLISFIVLGGKCAYCRKSISWRHPLLEVTTAMAACFLFPKYLNWQTFIYFCFFFTVFCTLMAHFFIDLDFQILPDGINLYLAILFLTYSLLFHSWPHWLMGGLLGFGLPLIVTWLFYKLRGKMGMGGGDIKLYGALGLYLGPQQIMMTLFLSSFLGALVGLLFIMLKKMNQQTPIAFGPFIIVVAMFQIFFPHLQERLMVFLFR